MDINNQYYTGVRYDVINLLSEQDKGMISRILEIGGGEFETLGFLSNELKCESWGVDIRKPINQSLKFVLAGFDSDIADTQIPNHYFNLIVANDVIEHIVDTDLFFRRAYEKLTDNGLLLLSVPNVRQLRTIYHLFCGSFPREASGLFDSTHLRWFCRRDVLSFAEKHNFFIKNWKLSGRLVPKQAQRIRMFEFLALHNIFLFAKGKAK